MAEVVTTIKGDGAAPWIVIHAETAAESERLITEALGGLVQTASEAGQLLTATVQASKTVGRQETQVPQEKPAFDWNKVGNPAPPPQQDWQQSQQSQAPTGGGWNAGQGNGFVGSAHPEGKRCTLCGSVLVGKQPKIKRMWSCPNQRAKDDGHAVEWING